jgi:hypothetical protein
MKTHMRPAVAAVTVVCLLAAGCDHPNTRPHDKARATAETFLESCAQDRPGAAIDVLTEPLQDAFARAGSPARACSRFLGVGAASQDDAALLATFRRAGAGDRRRPGRRPVEDRPQIFGRRMEGGEPSAQWVKSSAGASRLRRL